MVVVAVAGGTGSIGRAIVEAIVADGEFEVIVLSRKVRYTVARIMAVRR